MKQSIIGTLLLGDEGCSITTENSGIIPIDPQGTVCKDWEQLKTGSKVKFVYEDSIPPESNGYGYDSTLELLD
jgi:hypothetical protein